MAEPLIRQLTVGAYQVQTYLVLCPFTRQAVVIDPAGEPERLAALAREEGAHVLYLLHTHGHADHTLGSQALKGLLGAPLAMHEADDDFFGSPEGEADSLDAPPGPPADLRLVDGQKIEVGRLSIEVIHTPGHSPGSVCYLIGRNLFTGDTLFVGAVGRTDLKGASLNELLISIEQKILPLPEDTVIWPGHDYGETPTSTLAEEKRENPFITDFILES